MKGKRKVWVYVLLPHIHTEKKPNVKPPVIFIGSTVVPGDASLLDSLAVTANL